MAIDPLPTAPSLSVPAGFDSTCDAFFAALALWTAQANALASGMNAAATGMPLALDYVFDSSTAAADPGAGKLRFNNSTQNLTTALYIDLIDGSGVTQTATLDLFDDSTSTVKGFLKISEAADPSNFNLFAISSMTSPAGYRSVAGSSISQNGAGFTNGMSLTFSFTRTGDKGDTGASYTATSTTSLATGTGSKVFTTQAGLAYAIGMRVRAYAVASGDYMEGRVTAYSGTSLTVLMDRNNGTGTRTDWNIGLVGDPGLDSLPWIAGGGTANAQTGTYSPAITSLTDGLRLGFRAGATNTTATPTFQANATTARTIVKDGGKPLVAGDICQNGEYIVVYNLANTRWELIDPKSNNKINFFAYLAADKNNVTGNATVYTIPFDTVSNNVGGAFNTATGLFTAPVAGTLKGVLKIAWGGADDSMTIFELASLSGSTAGVQSIGYNGKGVMAHSGAGGGAYQPYPYIMKLAAGETVSARGQISGVGANTADMLGVQPYYTYWEGEFTPD